MIEIRITPKEHPEEREYRLQKLSRDARIRQAKDAFNWVAIWTIIIVVVVQAWIHLGGGR